MRPFHRLIFLLLPLLTMAAGPEGALAVGVEEGESRHFILRWDLPIERRHENKQFERDVLRILENGYQEIGRSLGIRPSERIVVNIWEPEIFEQRYGRYLPFKAGGFYRGEIHIRSDKQVSRRLEAILLHEFTHAAVDSLAPKVRRKKRTWWLDEGTAEFIRHRGMRSHGLSVRETILLRTKAEAGEIIPLTSLGRITYHTVNPENASLAYVESYAAILYLIDEHGQFALRRIIAQIAEHEPFEEAFRRETGLDVETFDRRFQDWISEL